MAGYILKHERLNGSIEAEYLNGILTVIKLDLKTPMNPVQFGKFKEHLEQSETDIKKFEALGFTINESLPPNKKIALFCEFYMKYKNGQKYKATRVDGVRIKEYVVNAEILKAYFTSKNFLFVGEAGSAGRHSVMNFCTYYNQVIAEMKNAGASNFPNTWSKEIEAKFQGKELYDYWAHLRGLGLKPVKNRVGVTTDWVSVNVK